MEADPSLRRVERTAVLVCLGMAALAWVLPRGGGHAALGVLGGGLLSALSYRTIGTAVTALVSALAPAPGADNAGEPPRRRGRWTLAKVAGRYALLALLAYVMIARLRLHPVGLLAGASSVVAAVSIEALRLLLKKS